jgi:hypothetical protein
MIFQHAWQQALDGTKTQTRRTRPPCCTVGQPVAVQPGRGKHAVGRIRVTAIRYCERAGDISEEDARAEGFADAAAFREIYERINGAGAFERPCWGCVREAL